MSKFRPICGLYYTHITIINDDSSIVNKFEASLTGDARVIIYDRHMFIVQATGHTGHRQAFTALPKVWKQGGRCVLKWSTLGCT